MALQSETNGSKDRLDVCLRIKPSSVSQTAYCKINETDLRVTSARGNETFQFSKIFKQNSTQEEVFESTAKEAVDSFLNGKDCLSFAYGTTNAGKTHSVLGSNSEPGIIPRSIKHIFDAINGAIDDTPRISPLNFNQAQIRNAQSRLQVDCIKACILQGTSANPFASNPPVAEKFSISFAPGLSSTVCDFTEPGTSPSGNLPMAFNNDTKCSLWISMFEVYNENVYDLLAPLSKGQQPVNVRSNVKILSDGMGNFIPQGNVEIHVNNLSEAKALMLHGQKQRTTMATLLNISSSRSHCILRVRLLRVDRVTPTSPLEVLSPAGDVDDFHVSTFMFIDLAGSERVDKAGTLKNRARETGNINSSLLVLGRCMEMLRLKGSLGTAFKNSVVPYRDSKLTMILQPLLSASGPKSLLVNINTCPELFEETMNVLKFSCVARLVEFKEPPKPVIKTRIPVPAVDAVETRLQKTESESDSSNSSDQASQSSVVTEEKKHFEDMISQFKKEINELQAENLNLEAEKCKMQTDYYEQECALKIRMQQEFDSIEQEMENSHKEALAKKESQLITLMEKRLDVQEQYYKGTLEINSADAKCSTQYIKALEVGVRQWEESILNYKPKVELEAALTECKVKTEEIVRLNKVNEEHLSEISNLKENLEKIQQSQNVSIAEQSERNVELESEVDALQKAMKMHVQQIKNMTSSLDEKDLKIKTLKESRKDIKAVSEKLQHDIESYKKVTQFIVNEYHPGARDSLATHNEEETWALLQKEFQAMPSKYNDLKKELAKVQDQLDVSREDYKKLVERRDALLASYEDELKIKTNLLDREKREVQALQKQLMGMTPRKMDITPKKFQIHEFKEFKTPMAALSNSVRSLNLNSPSPNVSTAKSLPPCKIDELNECALKPITRSSGKKKKMALSCSEKENSPVPVEKKKGKSRRKLCNQSTHPALDSLDSGEIDFKLPEENEVQKTKRRLRSTYK